METPLPVPPATPMPSGRKIEPPCAPHASTRTKLTSVGTTHDSSPPVASNRHLTRASSKGRLQPPDGNPLLVGVPRRRAPSTLTTLLRRAMHRVPQPADDP